MLAMTDSGSTRRGYLSALTGAVAVGVAGCSGGGDSNSGDSGDSEQATGDDGEEGGNTTRRDVVTDVRPAMRVEAGDQVGYLDVSLVAEHGIDEMRLTRDGRSVRTTTVDSGTRTVSFETGRDVRDTNILAAGNYTLVSLTDGEVVAEYDTTLEKRVEIENLQVGRKDMSDDGVGMETFRFDLVNVGELPIDFDEGYVTGDVPTPGKPGGFGQDLFVDHGRVDQWSGSSDGLQTVESFPGEGHPASATPVVIERAPLEAPYEDLPRNYCDGSPREATIHLRGEDGYRTEIDVRFSLAKVFGDVCLEGEVRSSETRSG